MKRKARAAGGRDQLSRPLQFVGVAAQAKNEVAFERKFERDGLANTASRTADNK
ncbi:MAG: hypothetical protein HC902_10585 [Calothrix sp. SM1_5_4]|nr:hypothetical protein [Calothrix sp. SM1_5_4]